MKYLFSLLLLFILSACKQRTNTASNFEFYPPIPDSLKNKFFTWRTAEIQTFNLPTLFSGTADSLVVRFIPWSSLYPVDHLFEFRLDTNGWKGYTYSSNSRLTKYGVTSIKGYKDLNDSIFFVKQIIPKCGWGKFYDSLNFFQLNTLPTQHLIKDFQHKNMLDPSGYTFEIAAKNSYRSISYTSPGVYTYKECRQIIELVSMIIRQLEDDYYWPLKQEN